MTVQTRVAPEPPLELAPAEPLVKLRGLCKAFALRRGWLDTLRHPFSAERATVVRDVTCSIGQGEFFGLLGHNGAGKTTLFKMLATLVIPDAGTASVGGHDVVQEGPAVRRLLAPVIADERSLSWRLSARENMKLYATLQGLRGRERDTRADELLEVVELADTGRRLAGQFSSGMKQRLLIARALLARPKVLLLDEPTRSLDPISARRFRTFLRDEISGRQRCTVLLATHNTEEALELCDRVAILDRGQLLAVGPADELAREVGESRYRVWTRDAAHPQFARLLARGRTTAPLPGVPSPEGWTPVEMGIPGGPESASEVLASLTGNGVTVAAFEPIKPSLADLIEQVVVNRRAERADA